MHNRMIKPALLSALLILLIGSTSILKAAAIMPASPEDRLLGHLPAGVSLLLYISSPNQFQSRLELAQAKLGEPPGDNLLSTVRRELGSRTAVDFNQPAAVAILSLPQGAMAGLPQMVIFLSTSKPALTLAAFSAKPIGNGIYQGSLTRLPNLPIFLAIRNGYLLLSTQAACIARCIKPRESLATEMSPASRHFLTTGDIAIDIKIKPVCRLYWHLITMRAPQMNLSVRKLLKNQHPQGSQFYDKAWLIFSRHALHILAQQVPHAMLTVRIGNSGLIYRGIAVPEAKSAVAKLFINQQPLGPTPFIGLPPGRYITAGAACINGNSLAGWLSNLGTVWHQHLSIRLSKLYPGLKQQLAVSTDILGDIRGISLINYAATDKPTVFEHHGVPHQTNMAPDTNAKQITDSTPGIMLIHIAHARRHLAQVLSWIAHPVKAPTGASLWLKGHWTVNPSATMVGGIAFNRLTVNFPPEPAVIPATPLTSLPTPQDLFGSKTVTIYVAAIHHRILLADISVPQELARSVRQIQHHRQNLASLPDIAWAKAFVPTTASALFYISLARWVSLSRVHTHKPIVGAMVIGGPVPPLLISSYVTGGCLVWQAYLPYSLLSALKDTSSFNGLPF